MGIHCESSSLLTTERGFIVEIAFSGRYGDGSLGNSDANEMATYVKAVVTNDQPAAVLFNLNNLQYRFGDAIGEIVFPLIINEESAIPACIVAHSATAQALQWIFQKSTIFGFAGFKLFSDREQGIAFLIERISAART